MKKFVTLWGLCILYQVLLISGSPNERHLKVIYEWKLLEYGFPTPQDREQAEASGNLVPDNEILIDVAPFYSRNGSLKVFVTNPKFAEGIPYTLAVVTGVKGDNGPVVQPYPNYEWHKEDGTKCTGLVSVIRVAIDCCDQMWVLDNGVDNGEEVCPPQLVVFDLKTDELVHRYVFDTDVYTPNATFLGTPVVKVNDPPPIGNCQDSIVYIADIEGSALVMYDYKENTAWRAVNRYMKPDPDYGHFDIANVQFVLMDGIFGLAITSRKLYFHPLASISEYSVPLCVLDNSTIWEENEEAEPNAFRKLGNRKSQCAAEAIDSHQNIYCVTTNPIELIQWNVNTPYNERFIRVIPADPKLLEFVGGMKVVRNSVGKEELWMLSNRFQKYMTDTRNPNEINFRVLKMKLGER